MSRDEEKTTNISELWNQRHRWIANDSSPINTLVPLEVFRDIFGYMPIRSLCTLSLVCKYWHRMLQCDDVRELMKAVPSEALEIPTRLDTLCIRAIDRYIVSIVKEEATLAMNERLVHQHNSVTINLRRCCGCL